MTNSGRLIGKGKRAFLQVVNVRAHKRSNTTPLPEIDPDPVQFAIRQLDFHPDPVQAEILNSSHKRLILNCSRQWGKTTLIALKALHLALTNPDFLVVVASPCARQSGEFIFTVKSMLQYLGIRARGDGNNRHSILLANKSRLVGIPGRAEGKVRGFAGTKLLILDEAAYATDALYTAVRPFLASSKGSLWLISTPNGKRGFFYHEWHHSRHFRRFQVPADQCPRIDPAFLEEERQSRGNDVVRQEYLCEFVDLNGSFFIRDLIDAALDPKLAPLFAGAPYDPYAYPTHAFYIGVDLGQRRDFSAITVVEFVPPSTPHYLTRQFSPPEFRLRYAEQLPLGTSYPAVIDRLAEITRDPELSGRCHITVDATGIGGPVMEQIRRAELPCPVTGVTITGGNNVNRQSGGYTVPKRDLLSSIQVLLEERQLRIAAEMPQSRRLIEEMMNLDPSPNSRLHDDLVLSLGLAAWQARRSQKGRY